MKSLKNLHPVDYVRLIWRRRWLALAVFILVSAGAGTYARFIPNVYRSESMIMVEPTVISQDYVRPSIRSTPEEQIAAIRSLVQSRSYLERMIQEFGLSGYGTNEKFSMDETVSSLSKNIQILNTSRNTFSIGFGATDPQLAQSFTRRMVENLIQSSSSSRKTRAVETDQFLDEQLRKTEQDLAAHEDKIRQFKMKHLGQLPEQSMANMNALSGLNTQLNAAETALQQAKERQKLLELRTQEQERLVTLTEGVLMDAPPALDAISNSGAAANPRLEAKLAELAALSSRYTPNHPDVVRLSREVEDLKKQSAAISPGMTEVTPPIGSEVTSAPEQAEVPAPETDQLLDFENAAMKFEVDSIRSEIAKREKEKNAILGQIKAYQAKLNLAPAIEQELAALSRQHEVLKQQYFNLQDKKSQAKMTANMETDASNDTYKIIDDANLPEKPAFPNRIQIVVIGLCAGLALGIGAAFGWEMLDTTLVSEEEATAVLDLPVLAAICEIPQKQPRKWSRPGRLPKSA